MSQYWLYERSACPKCDGGGEVWGPGELVTCGYCDGKGSFTDAVDLKDALEALGFSIPVEDTTQ